MKHSGKKVAFFIESLALGGIGRLTLVLAERFLERGFLVSLLVNKKKGDYLKQVPAAVKISGHKRSRLLFSIGRVGRFLKEEDPDVLITANERINIIALLAAKIYRPRAKIVISIHTNNTEQLRYERRGLVVYLYRKLTFTAARLTYRWADEVVAVSRGVAADASRLFRLAPEKIRVIYNPVVTPRMKELMKMPLDHPWFNDPAGPVILAMGRLTWAKDFITLLEAFDRVVAAIPGARLVILGEGKQRKNLEKKIAALKLNECVSLPGYIENPYNYLHRASLFVLSSRYEGFGNVLVEAMAAGTPVVATDCPSGPAEILAKGRYGPLVEPGDAVALSEAMLKVLANPPEPHALRTRAADFSVDNAVEEYLKLL